MLKDSRTGYGLITIILHWLAAPLIIFMFGLGFYMVDLDYYSTWYHTAPALHISLGIAAVSLMLVRLLWRTSNTSPERLATIDAKTMLAANLVKVALYVLVFTLGITGYLITTAEGQAASFFDLFGIPATLELSSDGVDLAGEIHEVCAWSLIGLVVLHAGAALRHHFIKHDRTLLRMLHPVKKSDF